MSGAAPVKPHRIQAAVDFPVRVPSVGVEMVTAVVGVIGSVIVALLARMAGLTRDDRRRAQIVRDAELWKALPEGSAGRVPLAEHIADATTALLDDRKRDRRLDQLWSAGAGSAFAAWVLLLAYSAVPFDPFEPFWVQQVRYAVLGAAGAAALLVVVLWVAAIWLWVLRAWAWLRTKV